MCRVDFSITAVVWIKLFDVAIEQHCFTCSLQARTHYLVAASAQYLALPVLLLSLTFLLHKSSPTGTGEICN